MKIVLDTNCFICAVNPQAPSYEDLQKIFKVHRDKQVELSVSLHTLTELEEKPDKALDLAKRLTRLPYWPIGSFDELVGTMNQLQGTFDDMKRNDRIQKELENLAKCGNDIRDRGALIDALFASVDAFVTSDKHLVGSAPAKRIYDRFQMRVLTPEEASDLLMNEKRY